MSGAGKELPRARGPVQCVPASGRGMDSSVYLPSCCGANHPEGTVQSQVGGLGRSVRGWRVAV